MSDTAQQGYLTLATQAEQGTPATTVTKGVRATSVALSGQTENLVSDPEIGGGRDVDTAGVALGVFSVAGNVEAYLRAEQLGYLLLGLGLEEVADPVQDAVTGAYSHTFTPAAEPTFLTLEAAWGANRAVRRFGDCLVDSLELSTAGNDWVTLVAAVVGMTETWQAGASTPVYPATDPIATWLGSAITLDGLGTYRLADMKASIANNIDSSLAFVGQRGIGDLTGKRREVTASGTVHLDGAAPESVTDLYRAAMYGSKTATTPGQSDPYHTSASMTFGSPKLIGTSTTKRYGVTLTMADVVVKAFPLEASGDDIITAAIELTAFDNGVDPVVSVELRNARATKYAAA